MGYDRRPYEESDSAGQMALDCMACSERLPVPAQRVAAYDAGPGLRPDLAVSDAAAHLAGDLHLHLD